MKYKDVIDSDGNEITDTGKIVAGVLITMSTLFSIAWIAGHWPNRMPKPQEEDVYYTYEWFHVILIDSTKSESKLAPSQSPQDVKSQVTNKDSVKVKKDSIEAKTPKATKDSIKDRKLKANQMEKKNLHDAKAKMADKCELRHNQHRNTRVLPISTVLLILVANAGFLGNMIFVGGSFTAFVGAGKFKKSWILWYFVKPFTAAALAMIMYFIFRAGLVNASDGSANFNVYGLMTISFLAGLFTDRATVKLKEVFDVLLQPREAAPDSIKKDKIAKLTGIKSEPLPLGKPTVVTLIGENLSEGRIQISVEGQLISEFVRAADSITFTYTLPEALQAKESIKVSVKIEDRDAKELSLVVKGELKQDANNISNAGDIVPDADSSEESTDSAKE